VTTLALHAALLGMTPAELDADARRRAKEASFYTSPIAISCWSCADMRTHHSELEDVGEDVVQWWRCEACGVRRTIALPFEAEG
jgi:hypothetical protein